MHLCILIHYSLLISQHSSFTWQINHDWNGILRHSVSIQQLPMSALIGCHCGSNVVCPLFLLKLRQIQFPVISETLYSSICVFPPVHS